MSKKIQSSVDWLISCITEDQMVKAKSLNEWLEIFEQAKAMQKDEIEYAWLNGMWGEMIAPLSMNKYKLEAEEYFNETFKGDNDE
jgi:hypothetical protein